MAVEFHLCHPREVFNELIRLTITRCQPDGAVGHAVGCQMIMLAACKGCDLTLHGHFLIADVIEAVDQVHTTSVVEEQGLAVTSSDTGDMEVEAARGDHFVGGEVKQGDAVLSNDQQLVSIIDGLQTERSVYMLNINDLRLVTADNHQMTGVARLCRLARPRTDSVRLAIIGSIYIPEAIVSVSYLPLCRQPPVLQLMNKELTVITHRQQMAALWLNIHSCDLAVMDTPTAPSASRLCQGLEHGRGIEIAAIVIRIKIGSVGKHIA